MIVEPVSPMPITFGCLVFRPKRWRRSALEFGRIGMHPDRTTRLGEAFRHGQRLRKVASLVPDGDAGANATPRCARAIGASPSVGETVYSRWQ